MSLFTVEWLAEWASCRNFLIAPHLSSSVIICVPRANLILSVVVFEELTDAWGNMQDCPPVDESLNYQSEQRGECLMFLSPDLPHPNSTRPSYQQPEPRSFSVLSAHLPGPLSPGCFEVMIDEWVSQGPWTPPARELIIAWWGGACKGGRWHNHP